MRVGTRRAPVRRQAASTNSKRSSQVWEVVRLRASGSGRGGCLWSPMHYKLHSLARIPGLGVWNKLEAFRDLGFCLLEFGDRGLGLGIGVRGLGLMFYGSGLRV